MNSNQEEQLYSLSDIKEHLRQQLTDQLKDVGNFKSVENIKAKRLLDKLNSELHVSDNGQPDETKE